MATVHKTTAGDNPYRMENSGVCPRCRSKDCPCFAAGSSATYYKVVRQLKEVLGWNYRNPSSPKAAWDTALRRVQTLRYRKGV